MRTGSPRIPGIPDGAGADLSAPSESRPYSRSKRHFAAAAAGDPWHRVSSPLPASSFVMLFTWILGTRVVFAILLELRANWIFRITQVRPATEYFAASRRAAYSLALAPAWCMSAALFLSLWPGPQALGHLASSFSWE